MLGLPNNSAAFTGMKYMLANFGVRVLQLDELVCKVEEYTTEDLLERRIMFALDDVQENEAKWLILRNCSLVIPAGSQASYIATSSYPTVKQGEVLSCRLYLSLLVLRRCDVSVTIALLFRPATLIGCSSCSLYSYVAFDPIAILRSRIVVEIRAAR